MCVRWERNVVIIATRHIVIFYRRHLIPRFVLVYAVVLHASGFFPRLFYKYFNTLNISVHLCVETREHCETRLFDRFIRALLTLGRILLLFGGARDDATARRSKSAERIIIKTVSTVRILWQLFDSSVLFY